MMKDYRQSLKEVQQQLNNQLTIEERINLINSMFPDDKYSFKNEPGEGLFDYINSELFKVRHILKKKNIHIPYEDTYLAIGLSNISNYLLEKWSTWDSRNSEHEQFNIWSDYEIQRGRKDKDTKRVIGVNMDVIDDFLENGLPDSVLKGLEVHIEVIEDYASKTQHKASEEEKRRIRKQEVMDNLEQYPDLMESYKVWKGIGLKYGFDLDEYSKIERDQLKDEWLLEFSKEEHIHSPQKRYYELRKQYNDMGYTLHTILKQLQKTVKIKKSQHMSPMINTDDQIYDKFDLSKGDHVAALLKIDYDKKNKEYLPLYYMLNAEYKDKVDSGIHYILEEFHEAVSETEFNDIEREIVELILDIHSEQSIYQQACTINPYSLIMKYINEKYSLGKSKANIIHIVNEKIASLIANTYLNQKIGTVKIKCSGCKKEKFASLVNFGVDTRNKTGFKSICKKCLAEKGRVNKVS
jgi:hypothetical protein